MKKIVTITLVAVFVLGGMVFLGQKLFADHCIAGYDACLQAAGDDIDKLDDCLRAWAACRKVYLAI